MDYHSKSGHFLAIRKDLYDSASARFYRARNPSEGTKVRPFCSGNEDTVQLMTSRSSNVGFDLFESHLHPDDRGAAPTPDCEEDGQPDDDDELRLFIDECKDNNNSQPAFECPDCGKAFSSQVQFDQHLTEHHHYPPISPTPGTWSGSSYDRQEDRKRLLESPKLQIHSSTSNPVHQETKTVYECDHAGCLRHYTSYSSFMKHRKTHQGPPVIHDLVPTSSTSGAISPTDVKRHQGEKKFQCSQCSKRFPTSKDLKRHDVVHTGNREFQCSFCSHRFGRKDHRMRHEKKTHAAELSPPAASSLAATPTPIPGATSNLTASALTPIKNAIKSSPAPPSSPSRLSTSSSPSLQQDQLVVQRQPQWSRRALTPPLPSPHGIKMEQYMDTIDEDPSALSPLLEDADSMSEKKPLDLQKILSGSLVVLDEMTLTSTEDGDDDASGGGCGGEGGDSVKGLDWIIAEFMSDEELPKSGCEPAGFYSPNAVKQETYAAPAAEPKPSLFGDLLTRTKNPVLPSVYVDNSQPLIVPEPSKQRYHNSPRSLLLEEDDFMADVDLFLREKDIFSNI